MLLNAFYGLVMLGGVIICPIGAGEQKTGFSLLWERSRELFAALSAIFDGAFLLG